MKIEPQVIHLWQIPLHTPISPNLPYEEILDTDELLMAKRLRSASGKQHYLTSHVALRHILSSYLGCLAKEIPYTFNKYGKRYLRPEENPLGIEFNLSHSQDLAVCAVAQEKCIGVDIEYLRLVEYQNEIAKQLFTPKENHFYLCLPTEQRQEAFFQLWTMKEAFIKAIGEGFSFGPENVGFSLFPPSVDSLPFPDELPQWYIHNFTPKSGYMGTIATKQPIRLVQEFEWSEASLSLSTSDI